MKTPQKHLRWLIQFGEEYPLEHPLKDWQRLKLTEEIRAFVKGDSDSVLAFPIVFLIEGKSFDDVEISPDTMTTLWARAHNLLSSIADSSTTIAKFLVKAEVDSAAFVHSPSRAKILDHVRAGLPIPRKIERQAREEKGRVRIPLKSVEIICNPKLKRAEISGSLLELFSMRCLLTLYSEDLSRIATCAECHQMFYRVRKQKYCSKRCINRVSSRKWRQKPKNRSKASESAHKRYERRIQRKIGGTLKVGRRQRSHKNNLKGDTH